MAANENTKNSFDEQTKDDLDRLPEKHREEILKQYDLPKVNVNFFTLLGYGNYVDYALQVVGSIMSVGAGDNSQW